MTELIVALDNINSLNNLNLAHKLHEEAKITWFKIGPQAILEDWNYLIDYEGIKKANYVIVGRPIWKSFDPVSAAIKHREALK